MRYAHKDTPWIVAYYGTCNRVYAGRREELLNAREGSDKFKKLVELLEIDSQDIRDLEDVLISRGLLNNHSAIV